MTTEKFMTLLERGWTLDHIFLLENIRDVERICSMPKGASLLQTLYRKGMVDEKNEITEQGRALIDFVYNTEAVELIKPEKPKIMEGIQALHKKLEDKLLQLTGKKQVRVDILGTKYSFLCGKEDLEARVNKVMKKYRIGNFQHLENTLLAYIDRCHKKNRWSPLIIYYILKSKEGTEVSLLVTDMRNTENEKEEATTNFEI